MNSLDNSTGLTREHMRPILSQQESRIHVKYTKIALAVGIVVGVISAVAFSTFACLKGIVYAPRVMHSSGVELIEENYLIFGVFGLVLGGPAIGVAIGDGAFGLGLLLRKYKVNQVAKLTLEIESAYDNGGIIAKADIIKLVKKGDAAAIVDMIGHMNLEQLLAAREAMGAKKFTNLIKNRREDFKCINFIFDLAQEKNIKSLERKLNNVQLRLAVNRYPLLLQLVQNELKNVRDDHIKVLMNSLRYPIEWGKEESVSDIEYTLNFQGTSYPINERMMKHCATLNSMKDDLDETTKSFTFDSSEATLDDIAPKTFQTFLALCHEKFPIIDKETLFNLLPLFDYFEFSPTVIEHLVLSQVDQFNMEELLVILESVPASEKIKKIIETHSLSYPLNRQNWSKIWLYSSKFDMRSLKHKCEKHAQYQLVEKLKEQPTRLDDARFWFNKCQEFSTAEALAEVQEDLCNTLGVGLATYDFAKIYTFATENAMQSLVNLCETFCEENREAIFTNNTWAFGEMPEAIAKIIYSKTS